MKFERDKGEERYFYIMYWLDFYLIFWIFKKISFVYNTILCRKEIYATRKDIDSKE